MTSIFILSFFLQCHKDHSMQIWVQSEHVEQIWPLWRPFCFLMTSWPLAILSDLKDLMKHDSTGHSYKFCHKDRPTYLNLELSEHLSKLTFIRIGHFEPLMTPTWPLEKIWARSLMKGTGPVVILTKFGQNRPKNVGAVGFWKYVIFA